MRKILGCGAVMTALFALSCGSQSSKSEKEAAPEAAVTTPDTIPTSLVQDSDLQAQQNLVSCKQLHADSLICAFEPAMTLVNEFAGQGPALLKFRYSMKCLSIDDDILSPIAIQTDSQVRRLQLNVENREISIFSRDGGEANLARVIGNKASPDLSGTLPCWYFTIEHIGTETFASDEEAEQAENAASESAQQDGLDNASQGETAGAG